MIIASSVALLDSCCNGLIFLYNNLLGTHALRLSLKTKELGQTALTCIDTILSMAHERGTWRGLVREALQELNCSHEEEEARSKDQLKQRREAPGHPPSPTPATSLPHTCTVPGCTFVGRTKAGLVNHIRQRHGVVSQVFHPCPHCGGSFHKQGLHNHSRSAVEALHNNQTPAPNANSTKVACITLRVQSRRGGGGVCVCLFSTTVVYNAPVLMHILLLYYYYYNIIFY